MNKFGQYLKPDTSEKKLSLTEQIWHKTKQKFQEEEKESEIINQQQEQLKKKLVVEKIVDVNVIREEFTGEHLFEKENIKEDGAVPVNVVGGGQVAGLGVGQQGEPGINPKKKKAVVPFKTFVRKAPK